MQRYSSNTVKTNKVSIDKGKLLSNESITTESTPPPYIINKLPHKNSLSKAFKGKKYTPQTKESNNSNIKLDRSGDSPFISIADLPAVNKEKKTDKHSVIQSIRNRKRLYNLHTKVRDCVRMYTKRNKKELIVEARNNRDFLKERICHCRYSLTGSAAAVKKTVNNSLSYSGLQSCGSAFTCPICGLKIENHRFQQTYEAIQKAVEKGYYFTMVTFNLKHEKHDSIKYLWNCLQDSFSDMTRNYAYGQWKKNMGVIGDIRSFESTYTLASGYHPHFHVLYFTKEPPERKFDEDLFNIWSDEVYKKRGFHVSREAFFFEKEKYYKKVLQSTENKEVEANNIAKYINSEIAEGAAKELSITTGKTYTDKKGRKQKSFSMFELLNNGFELEFFEYYQACKGRTKWKMSRGLRSKLGLNMEDKTDKDIAESEEELKEPVVFIEKLAWKVLKHYKPELLNRLEYAKEEHLNKFLDILFSTKGVNIVNQVINDVLHLYVQKNKIGNQYNSKKLDTS